MILMIPIMIFKSLKKEKKEKSIYENFHFLNKILYIKNNIC